MNLSGKRLLNLGGAYNCADIKEYAEKQGIVLIAAGTNPNHPSFKIADETYIVDVINRNELIKLIRDAKIDGVFGGGNEDVISVLLDIAQETGIYFYASKEQWEITGNKRMFKKACIEAGLPVVPEFYISNPPTRDELSRITYPVVIKPIDGSGSRGVHLCSNEDELIAAQVDALMYSRSKTLMVEKFMTGFITVFYMTVIESHIYPASMCDKYTKPSELNEARMPTIAQMYLYPSRKLDYCLSNYYPEIQKLLHNLKITNGVVGIQGFCDGEKTVFTEMGYRLGGTSQQNYTKALYGYSNMYLLINHALTGKMTELPCLENPFFNKFCGTLQMISKGGTIGRTEGIDAVKSLPQVICVEEHYKEGDTIQVVDNVTMVHYRLFIVADSLSELKTVTRFIQDTVKVYDTHGEPMLEETFDVERLDRLPNGSNDGLEALTERTQEANVNKI